MSAGSTPGEQQGPLDRQGIEIRADECDRRGFLGWAGNGEHSGDVRRKRVGMQHRQGLPDLVHGAAPVLGRQARPGPGQRHPIDHPGDLPRQLVMPPSINDLRIGNPRRQRGGDSGLAGEPVAVTPPADTQHGSTDPPDVVGVAGDQNWGMRRQPDQVLHASEPGLAGGGSGMLHALLRREVPGQPGYPGLPRLTSTPRMRTAVPSGPAPAGFPPPLDGTWADAQHGLCVTAVPVSR
jgi:hypothetical protein